MAHRIDTHRSKVGCNYVLPGQGGMDEKWSKSWFAEPRERERARGLHEGQGEGAMLQKPISSHVHVGKHVFI